MSDDGSLALKEIITIVVISGVTTLSVFMQGALTVAIPTIGTELKFSQENLHWPINAFTLALAGLLLFFSRLADVLGHKSMFLAGTTWFAIWSLAAAFATSDTLFIIFTAMEGVGVAANIPAAIGLFSITFPPGPKRNKALGSLGAGQPIGFICGLIIGGLLVETSISFRAIYYFQCGFATILVIAGFAVLLPADPKRVYTKGIDYIGAALNATSIALLTYSISTASDAEGGGWKNPRTIGIFVGSIVLFGLFVGLEYWRDRRGLPVLLPIAMWRRPQARLSAILSAAFLAWWSFNTLIYFFTLYHQQVLLFNSTATALRLIPMALASVVINFSVGYLMGRLPGRPLMIVGFLCTAAAGMMFALIRPSASWWAMAFPMMILVAACDVAYPIGTLHITSSFDDDSQSLAGGLFNVATALGSTIGVAVSSTIATSVSRKYALQHSLPADSPQVLLAGFRMAGWTCVTAVLLAACITALGLRGLGIVGRRQDLPSLDEKTPNAETTIEIGEV